MPTASFRAATRRRLVEALGRPVFVLGHGLRDRNLPGYGLRWRQDSTMLYLIGDPGPGCHARIEADGTTTVFRPPVHPDSALWEGEAETDQDLRARLGVDRIAPLSGAEAAATQDTPAMVACADAGVNAAVSRWTGRPLQFGEHHGDDDLVDVLIPLRRRKAPEELAAMRVAAEATVAAHRLAMAATTHGTTERALHVLFQAALHARGCSEGYDTILTQQGEVLHHHGHDAVCHDGRMVLCDGGGEVDRNGYGVDVTRTWPVSGRFSPRQRAAYDAVLEAHDTAAALLRPGVGYREVHLAAARVLTQHLVDEGLLQGACVDDLVARGAHAVFFPHGVGHLLGLDVHDLEAFGDRAAYPAGARRSPQFGLSNLRLDLPVEAGWVVTIEPGLYVVPSILGDARLHDALGDLVNWEAAEGWLGFGGIRIENDWVVTDAAPENLTAGVPAQSEAVEALVGRGASLDDVLAA